MSKRGAGAAQRRGAVLIAMIVMLLVVTVAAVGLLFAVTRSHALTTAKIASVEAFYAAEAGMSMGVREVVDGVDADGDGGVGSISDDGNDLNDPALGSARVRVARTDTIDGVELRAGGRRADARRAVAVSLAPDVPVLECGRGTVGAAPVTVSFAQAYRDPVVVCSANLARNSVPLVVRVDSVTTGGFRMWLQNPGDTTTPVAETVWWLVVEAGQWSMDGIEFEAQHYTSRRTDHRTSWAGERQEYLGSYTRPVVIGQVMTAGDGAWSAFWCRGASRTRAPDPSRLFTGKHVAEDGTTLRADEEIGFVVFEAGHAMLGGQAFEALVSAPVVRGVGDAPPYPVPFAVSFSLPPTVILVGQLAMDGNNGGWAVPYGAAPALNGSLRAAIDEDQLRDAERAHTSEQVGALLFREPVQVLVDGVLLRTWAEVRP